LRHVVSLNLSILERVGIQSPRLEFPLEATPSAVVHDAVAAMGGPFALLNPGAAWPNKRWPPARLAAVASALRERHGMRSLVLWGPGERPLADAVAAQAAGAALVAPHTTIADMVAFTRAAAIMVSGDTGPAHIASAVGTPIVAIYGPTRPERNGPISPDDVSVSRAPECQCHHLRSCRRDRMCLLDIGVGEVTEAVERRLSRTDRASG
jgi:ADP-heptose:LPS heptosyltransferase